LIPVERMRALLRTGQGAYVVAPRRTYDELRSAAVVPLRIVYEDAYGAVFVADVERPAIPG